MFQNLICLHLYFTFEYPIPVNPGLLSPIYADVSHAFDFNHFTAVLFFRKTKKSNFQESIFYHLGFMSRIIFKETTYRFYVAIMLIMSLSMILFETWNDA